MSEELPCVNVEVINLKRFYLAFRISKCPKCKVEVLTWEAPIVFKSTAPNGWFCEKHQKQVDEFNRNHASD